MNKRKSACEAVYVDNGRDDKLIPVCMGGAATTGAFETIVGCNNAAKCLPQLKCRPGYDKYVSMEGRMVTGVSWILHEQQPPISFVDTESAAGANSVSAIVTGSSLLSVHNVAQHLRFTPDSLVSGI